MTTSSSTIRLGIVGLGTMGAIHAGEILAGKVKRVELTAVCDSDPQRLAHYSAQRRFTDSGELMRSGAVDVVLVATPHYGHVAVGIQALEHGLHVLVEKPLAVHKADCQRLIDAYERRPKPDQRFAIMFNMRTMGRYAKVREMIDAGEFGAIRRFSWTVTECFRSDAYYASAGWRATWKGEGGGVLVNQVPHQLDLMQWLFGMPSAVRARCGFGKWHAIETEDEVTAMLEYPDGTTGVFVASTGEAPGSNRLEIAAERGRVVIEGDRVTYTRNVVPASEFRATTKQIFGKPETWQIDLPIGSAGGEHNRIIENLADAILDGAPLIAPAVDGIRSVELANAMVLSSLTDQTIRLPMDAAEYGRCRIRTPPDGADRGVQPRREGRQGRRHRRFRKIPWPLRSPR
jgi:predicted dehydrogenase